MHPLGQLHLCLGAEHHLAVHARRQAASIALRHPPHAHQRVRARPEHQLLQVADPWKVPRPRRRKDPLAQPPYPRLACASRSGAKRRSRPLVRSPRRQSQRLTCPSVPGSSSSSSSQAHLTASARFRIRARRPVSGQLSGTTGGGASRHVPVSCCLSAAGIRFSVIRFPPGSWAFLAVGLPDTIVRTPSGLPRSTRTSYDRGGCLLYPEDGDAHPAGPSSPTGACRFPAASPYTPLQQPISGASDNEASTKVYAIHPSGLPLACGPRMERAPLGFSPELRTPPPERRRRTSGWGRALSTSPGQRSRHQPDLQSAHPLETCDLVSQRPPLNMPTTTRSALP